MAGDAAAAGGVALGAGDAGAVGVELGAADTGGDMLADGVAAGAELGGAVAAAEVLGAVVAAVWDMLGAADVCGAEVAGDDVRPDAACPECMPGGWWEEAVKTMPPAAEAARSPTTIDAMASGRPSPRRRRRPSCRPG